MERREGVRFGQDAENLQRTDCDGYNAHHGSVSLCELNVTITLSSTLNGLVWKATNPELKCFWNPNMFLNAAFILSGETRFCYRIMKSTCFPQSMCFFYQRHKYVQAKTQKGVVNTVRPFLVHEVLNKKWVRRTNSSIQNISQRPSKSLPWNLCITTNTDDVAWRWLCDKVQLSVWSWSTFAFSPSTVPPTRVFSLNV